jgi:hypothetical protein
LLAARVAQLNTLASEVKGATYLAASDRASLLDELTDVELPGIGALQPEAQSATDCSQLLPVARAMVFNYRVYLLMTPQTQLTVVADRETHMEQVLAALAKKTKQAIASTKAAGKDVSAAHGTFSDVVTLLSSAESATKGLSSTLLALTPPGYPANGQQLLNAATAENQARQDLIAAQGDIDQIDLLVR